MVLIGIDPYPYVESGHLRVASQMGVVFHGHLNSVPPGDTGEAHDLQLEGLREIGVHVRIATIIQQQHRGVPAATNRVESLGRWADVDVT